MEFKTTVIVFSFLFCGVFSTHNTFNDRVFNPSVHGPTYQGSFPAPPINPSFQGLPPPQGAFSGSSFGRSGIQNVDYSLQGSYQAQVQTDQYVTSHNFPNYNQPGLPWHARQEVPVTHHVVHHHVPSPPQYAPGPGPMPVYPGPPVIAHQVQPVAQFSVGVPIVNQYAGPVAPVYQPDLLTRAVTHPVGRVLTTAGLAALFYKAID